MASEMQPVDCLRSTAICMFFLVTGFGKQSTYLKGDFMMLAVSSIGCLFFPEVLLETNLEQEIGVIHVLYARLMGCVLLTLLAVSYLLRDAEDDNVTAAQIMSRVMAGGVLLSLQLNALRTLPAGIFSIQAVTGGLLTTVLWFASSLYQVVTFGKAQSGYWNPNLKLDNLTRFIMVDTAMGFLAAFWCVAYADFGVSAITMKGFKPDEVHLIQYRQIGAMSLGIALISLAAVSFSDEDKKKVLLARLIFIGSLVTIIGASYWAYGIHTRGTLAAAFTMYGVWALVCLAGYKSETRDD